MPQNRPSFTALYDFVTERILVDFIFPGSTAIILGTGDGRMIRKLESFGCEVVTVDRSDAEYGRASRRISVDFNDADFAGKIRPGPFQLVTALEILEHVENPIGFLRNIRALLAPNGVAVLTVAKLDLLPAPVKFVLDHAIKSIQHSGDTEMESPIFWEFFCMQFLAFAGMALRDHQIFPQESLHRRASLPWLFRHILVIEPLNAPTRVLSAS